jgi:hypothetical protein
MAQEHTGNSAMFGIFVLSIYSLFLIPFTLYRVCAGSEEEEAAQPWQASAAAAARTPGRRADQRPGG